MEFEELQKIWDTQSNQPLYVINEKELHNRILAKKKQTLHFAHMSEWGTIIANAFSGGFMLWTISFNKLHSVFIYLLAAWMFCSALYALISRLRRLNGQHRFNRSLLGDLQHAIATASYLVRLSRIMRWNIMPIAILVVLHLWEGGKPVWIALATSLFFIGVFYATGWETNFYKAKKRELEALQKILQQED